MGHIIKKKLIKTLGLLPSLYSFLKVKIVSAVFSNF